MFNWKKFVHFPPSKACAKVFTNRKQLYHEEMFSKSFILEESEGAFHPNTDLAVGMEAERESG